MIERDIEDFMTCVSMLVRVQERSRKSILNKSDIDIELSKLEKSVGDWQQHIIGRVSQLEEDINRYKGILDFILSFSFASYAKLENSKFVMGQKVMYCGEDIGDDLKRGDNLYYYGPDPDMALFHLIGPGDGPVFFMVPRHSLLPLQGTADVTNVVERLDLKNPKGWA